MTDKYGSDSGQHEQAEGHEQHMTGENETWTGEPPVDDFHAGEEAATVSEEVEEHDTTGGDTGGHGGAPRKSLALPIIAGVGGLLFLGAILYWQFSNNAATAQMPVTPPLSNPMTANQAAATSAVPKPAAPAPSDVAPTTGLESATDDFHKKPVTAMPNMSGSLIILHPDPNADASQVPAPAPDAAAPVAPSVAPPATAAAQPPVDVQPSALPAPSPVQPSQASAIDARLAMLSAHVDDLQKSLAQATQQLTQVTSTLAANGSSATGTNPSIDDRLNKIEQKLMQLQHGTSSSATDMADAGTIVAPEKTTVHSHKHKVTTKKTRSVKGRKTSLSSYTVTPHQESKPAVTTKWVLRAATPDEAWVATDATSPELRHIQVGDNLSGIGKVKAIHQNGDSWVVEGTAGTIQ